MFLKTIPRTTVDSRMLGIALIPTGFSEVKGKSFKIKGKAIKVKDFFL